MSWRKRWVVLVPGKLAWVERRTREILEEEGDGSEHHFMVVPGQGRYQAIVQKSHQEFTPEMLLGRTLSLECEEPVYSIEGREEFPYVCRFLKGEDEWESRDPEDLVQALGCVMPWGEEPSLPPHKGTTRTVALIQGLSKAQVLRVLEKDTRPSPPLNYYRLEEAPQGLLLSDWVGAMGSVDVAVAERYPRAVVYGVTARPDLELLVVYVMRGRKIEQFSYPPKERPLFPAIDEVLGERTPERILAALGIPREWFRL